MFLEKFSSVSRKLSFVVVIFGQSKRSILIFLWNRLYNLIKSLGFAFLSTIIMERFGAWNSDAELNGVALHFLPPKGYARQTNPKPPQRLHAAPSASRGRQRLSSDKHDWIFEQIHALLSCRRCLVKKPPNSTAFQGDLPRAGNPPWVCKIIYSVHEAMSSFVVQFRILILVFFFFRKGLFVFVPFGIRWKLKISFRSVVRNSLIYQRR